MQIPAYKNRNELKYNTAVKMFKKTLQNSFSYCKHSAFFIRLQTNSKEKTEKPEEIAAAKNSKISTEILAYLDSCHDYDDVKDKIPRQFLKKHRTSETLYLINKNTAKEIVETVKTSISKNEPIVEVNPGLGLLSKELLLQTSCPIYMYENTQCFAQSELILDLQKHYKDRITYNVANFFGMGKLAFQDKMDNGNRLKELLGELNTEDTEREVNIIGAMPGIDFVKHLIHNIVFHNTHHYMGRANLFMAMSIHQVETLTNIKTRHSKLSHLPSLFNLLFDAKVLSRLPQMHYLPWINHPKYKTNEVLKHHFLYLVNITQKKNPPCAPDYMPLLWYFFRPHMMSKTTRVIPMLEQWIPGCGVWLITGLDPPDTNTALGPSEQDAKLPHINIFTEFGDLSLQQKVTVFKRFVSWPEFEQCPFRVTMENNLPKSISAIDSDDADKDKITVVGDEDDEEDSDSEG